MSSSIVSPENSYHKDCVAGSDGLRIPSTAQYFHAPESTWPHFESVRYSAVTCDPDELRERGYILRQTPVYNSRHVNNGRGSVGIATSNEGYSAYAWVGNNDIWENGWAVADGPTVGGDRPRIEVS